MWKQAKTWTKGQQNYRYNTNFYEDWEQHGFEVSCSRTLVSDPKVQHHEGLDLPEWDYCSVLLIGMGGNEGVTIGTKMDSGLNKFANKNSMFRKNMLSKLLLNACLNHVACAA